MQNRLTQKAQNALTKSLTAAEELGHTYVGTEHLLIGLAEEEDSAAARILDGKGITPLRIRDAVREISGAGSRTSLSASEMTPRARTVIEEAGRVADDLSGGFVGTEHVLSAICREKECTGYRILVSFSADPGQIVREIGQIAGGSAPKTEKNPTETDGEIPTLLRFGIDLTASARAGKLDPVIGRTKETARLIAILCRKTKNNPCLVGEPGVGKTAVVEGLAQKIVSGDVPEPLLDRRIVSLDLSSMIAGAKYRGEFEERMRGIIDEATKHPGVILFIDEVHTLIGAGAAEGAVDAANILKPALARGAIRLIGATTPDEYERHIERDSALERRFQPVPVREPDRDETLAVLRGIRGKLEEHHGVKLPDGALEAAITLSVRYLPDKYLPDKAIDLLDEAAARLWLSGLPSPAAVRELQREIDELRASLERAVVERDFEQAAVLRDRERVLTARRDALLREREEQRSRPPVLSYDDLAAVLTDGTGIPVCRMKEENKLDYNAIVAGLSRRIVGQDEAICAVSHAVCRGRLGLSDARRPIGSFLFLGPTGVGKTELSRALAETVFGSPSALLRFDMTEYRESHSISRLIGSPPGYVGHEEGGQLSEKLRRHPYSVVLFDEVEKANREVLGILLQMMDDGALTDGRGRRIDCRNCILILTSNLGATYAADDRPIGFSGGDRRPSDELLASSALREIRQFFTPEFLNRIDETVVFRRLSKDDLCKIAENMLREAAERAKGAGVSLSWDEALPRLIAENGADEDAGARPMRRYLTKRIEDPLADLILASETPPEAVRIGVEDGKPRLRNEDAALMKE